VYAYKTRWELEERAKERRERRATGKTQALTAGDATCTAPRRGYIAAGKVVENRRGGIAWDQSAGEGWRE
jgi:hypothetical protein